MPKGYFIQYKFILPENTNHSSYTYQKLFRALYGYTQKVTKSSGRSYSYHRKGVLSDTPYIRSGKNCVIIPKSTFSPLTEFFKTGKNPTHYWRSKGDWKAVYYMDEKNLTETEVIKAMEDALDRNYVLTTNKDHQRLSNELQMASQQSTKADESYHSILVKEAEKIVSNTWFKENYRKSPKLTRLFNHYKDVRGRF